MGYWTDQEAAANDGLRHDFRCVVPPPMSLSRRFSDCGVSCLNLPLLCRRLCAGVVLTLLLAAAAPPPETVLQRGNKDEPETLDPHKSDGYQEYWVQSDLFEGLTRIDAQGKVVPGVAESWDVAPNGLAWTFHLRHGLKWSDGSPLTAQDFVWSFRRGVDPATGASYASAFYPVVGARAINDGQEKDLGKLGVAAPDPDTVVIRLTEPTAYLAGVLSLGIGFPLPRKVIEAYGAEWTKPGHLIGNGAFMLDSWTPQSEIRLTRNPNYHDAAAVKLDAVVWSVNPDDETALKRYRAGDLDIARVPRKLVPALEREMPRDLHTGTTLWTRILAINTQKPPFSDVRLRQALAMLIDRDTLVQRVDPHGQAPAYALVAPGLPDYTPQPPDWAGETLEARREQAAALLAEAGYGPDKPAHLEVIYGADENDRRLLTAISNMVKPYGIDFVPVSEENQIVLAAMRDHDFQGGYTGWLADYPDPWTFLSCYRSDATGLNNPDYRNPEYDGLLAKAAATLDPAARNRLLEAAEKLLNRDEPVVALTYDNYPRVVNPKISGFFDNPLDQHASRDMSIVR